MSPELALPRGKEEGCLSCWQLSQLALGRSETQQQAHADDCGLCAQRLHEERELIAAAALERLPQVLLARADTSTWLRHGALQVMPWAIAGLAVAAVVLGLAAWRAFIA